MLSDLANVEQLEIRDVRLILQAARGKWPIPEPLRQSLMAAIRRTIPTAEGRKLDRAREALKALDELQEPREGDETA